MIRRWEKVFAKARHRPFGFRFACRRSLLEGGRPKGS